MKIHEKINRGYYREAESWLYIMMRPALCNLPSELTANDDKAMEVLQKLGPKNRLFYKR